MERIQIGHIVSHYHAPCVSVETFGEGLEPLLAGGVVGHILDPEAISLDFLGAHVHTNGGDGVL